MIYNVGDILVCKKKVDSNCLEMTNPYIEIKPGDRFKVTDMHKYEKCQWCELESLKDKEIILNAWNDEDHMIIDDCFEKTYQ